MQPSLVICYFGGNDSMGPHPSGLGPHVPLEEYVENMRKIAVHLKVCNQLHFRNHLMCFPNFYSFGRIFILHVLGFPFLPLEFWNDLLNLSLSILAKLVGDPPN